VFILSTGFIESLALYEALPKDEKIEDGEVSLPILK
jgi:hypothetical protein